MNQEFCVVYRDYFFDFSLCKLHRRITILSGPKEKEIREMAKLLYKYKWKNWGK